MLRILRPYQLDALAGIRGALNTHASTVCVLPTGTGKTSVASTLMNEWPGGNCLFLAHTRELVDQAASRLAGELGYQPVVEMGIRGGDEGLFWQGGMIVVGSVQSMLTDRRLKKYERNPFDLIVIDECFPAGTMVDGKPIESFKIGDKVTAFDPDSRELRSRTVQHVFRKPAPKTLVRITSAGQTVTATLNHPFLTARGWINAGSIQVGDSVYGLLSGVCGSSGATEVQVPSRGKATLVQSPVLRGVEEPAGSEYLRKVSRAVHGGRKVAALQGHKVRAGVLLEGMHSGSDVRVVVQHVGNAQSEVCLSEDENEQSHDAGRSPSEGIGDDACERMQAHLSWRERARTDGDGISSIEGNGAFAVRSEHTRRSCEWLPDALQTRLGESRSEGGNRDRRWESLFSKGASSRPSQGDILAGTRVDRVEILQRGSVGGCDDLCPDGCVYNLEVEGEHTYLANGFAVHNCHRATSRSYRKVVEFFTKLNPSCKTVGLTATPNRADGTALGLVFESVGYAMDIPDAIDDGWLVPVRQRSVVVSDVEITGPNRTNEVGEKDFTDSAVEEVMIDEAALAATAEPLVREAVGRPTIVFCATVRHAHELAAMIDRYAPGSAAAVDGETPHEQRAELIKKFQTGQIQFLCNAQLFVEGFDAPTCSCVAVARPTKSTGRYTQMVGRGLRPLPGTVDGVPDVFDRKTSIFTSDKPDALVLDFVNAGAAGLVTIDDILGGDYDAEVRELAVRDRKDSDTSVSESLKRAKFLLALEREMEQRQGNRSTVNYEVYDRDGRPIASNPRATIQRGTITDGQLGLLISLGMEPSTATPMSSRQAGAVIDSMKKNRCTIKQRAALERAGINPNGLGMDHASRIIDVLKANGWKRPEVLPT